MDQNFWVQPLRQFPIRVCRKILGLGADLVRALLLTLSQRQRSHPSFFYAPSVLLSHSDPVTPGLFSGLGTVDVGEVPLGS